METIDSLVDQRLEADTDFQNSLADLSDDDKNAAIANKRTEIANAEFKSLSEKAAETDKQKELANNYKIRAEKAEEEAKKGKKDDRSSDEKKDELTPKDIYALMGAQVPEEDIEEVVKAAKVLGKSISEALKDSVVKTILSRKVEERSTANAANTGSGRRTTPAMSDDKLLSELSKGIVPEAGSKEAEALFWAKRGGKRK